MNRKTLAIAIVSLVVCIAIVAILVSSRHWLTHQAYMRSARSLESRLDPTLANKYAKDMQYTLDKFWRCYERGLVSRNDLNDVMEKMHLLRDKKNLENMDVFDFLGYVSELYTEAIQKHQREMLPE
ncbi:MAG: hypothetical protein PHD74_07600 [Candidatus Krumholzibacteria bacterium]|nr:hypothetical protein [Candidatus Krumholzibacteria bacterium]